MDFVTYIVDTSLVFIPMLLIIGKLIKDIEVIPNKFIPLILLPIGIASAMFVGGATVDSFVQGVLVTGASVYGNQLYKQMKTEEK